MPNTQYVGGLSGTGRSRTHAPDEVHEEHLVAEHDEALVPEEQEPQPSLPR